MKWRDAAFFAWVVFMCLFMGSLVRGAEPPTFIVVNKCQSVPKFTAVNKCSQGGTAASRPFAQGTIGRATTVQTVTSKDSRPVSSVDTVIPEATTITVPKTGQSGGITILQGGGNCPNGKCYSSGTVVDSGGIFGLRKKGR